jgi:molecular chaperone GrpE
VNYLDSPDGHAPPHAPSPGENAPALTAPPAAELPVSDLSDQSDQSDVSDQSDLSDQSDQSDLSAAPELRARAADLEDRWKRAAADLDNHRKRFDRELDRLRQLDRETIFRAWLSVVDDMERALCSQGASASPWYEGMEAIHSRMLAVLDQFGVKPFVPQGETFDPNRHEAVATANLPGEPEGKIVEVVETGYLLDGKVLRPARVIAVKKQSQVTS